MSTKINYLAEAKKTGTTVKVFLESGTMLSGKIVDYDEDAFVVDKCLVNWRQVISIKPA